MIHNFDFLKKEERRQLKTCVWNVYFLKIKAKKIFSLFLSLICDESTICDTLKIDYWWVWHINMRNFKALNLNLSDLVIYALEGSSIIIETEIRSVWKLCEWIIKSSSLIKIFDGKKFMNLVKYQQVTNEPTSRRRWGWEKVLKKHGKWLKMKLKIS